MSAREGGQVKRLAFKEVIAQEREFKGHTSAPPISGVELATDAESYWLAKSGRMHPSDRPSNQLPGHDVNGCQYFVFDEQRVTKA